MPITNYYEKVKRKGYKHRSYYNPNKNMPQHPFCLCLVGPSRSGKTNILRYMIDQSRNFDKIYLYAKKLDEPLYEDLIEHWEKIGQRCPYLIIEYSNDVTNTVDVNNLNESIQNLIIFDDMVTEKNLKNVEELFIRGRKQNASIVFISQSYFSIPKDIRLNCDYFILTRIGNKKELTEIAKDHTIEITTDQFYDMYRIVNRVPFSFMVIDLRTQDPKWKYRKEFDDSLWHEMT